MYIAEHNQNLIRIQDKPQLDNFLFNCPTNAELKNIIQTFQKIQLDLIIKTSAVYSSNIEGNPVDVNSFMRIENSDDVKLKKNKSFQEIEELKKAFEFAMQNSLSEENFLKTHFISAKNLIISNNEKGKYRTGANEALYDEDGKIIYVALETKYVQEAMQEFWQDLADLISQKLSLQEIVYYSALIHLIFVKIHPFRDGNGRMARLLQKWFLSCFLGEVAWKLPLEKYYKQNLSAYYANLNLGFDIYENDYFSKKVLQFMQMSLNAMD